MSNGRQKQRTSTTFHLLAGLASGFTSSVLLQPADLLKTRVQQSGSSSLTETIHLITSQPHPIRQLWRGTLPSCIRTSIGSALYFTTLNSMRQSLARPQTLTPHLSTSSRLPQLSATSNLLSGAVARASVGFIMMPITVIKVRYESSYYSYQSIVSAARDIAAKEGLRGFFAGFGATALRDAPYAGLYVLFYEQSKKFLSGLAAAAPAAAVIVSSTAATVAPTKPAAEDYSTSAEPPRLKASTSAGINFASSTVAASLATVVTNPPDAVKTRLQLHPRKYRNMLQAVKLMVKQEGMRSLFDGLILRMTRKALSSALAWTLYEDLVRRAESRWVDVG